MKSFIKKNILRSCSVALAACLISGVAVAAADRGESYSSATAYTNKLENVTGKVDASELGKDHLNKEYVSANATNKNQEYWFIVEFDDESLMGSYNRSGKYGEFSDYLTSKEGRARQDELAYAQRKFLSTLDKKGISYEKKYSYTELMSGLALKVKLKDVAAIEAMSGVKAVYTSESYAAPAVAVTNNANVYTTGIYNTKDIEYKGDGMVVAVLDTGLDYTHDAFQTMPDANEISLTKEGVASKLGALESRKRKPSLSVSDVYYNEKVPYAYDYADDDADVYPAYSTHGTHVAGIVAGRDDEVVVNENGDHFVGVVPNAQLVICKVFSDNLELDTLGGANSVDILAAITDCVKLGVDVINMSLGTSAGFSDETGVTSGEYVISEVYKLTEAAGISLVVAASNDYSSGFGGAYGTNLALNPDSGTIGSPSTYPYALSVASINGVPSRYMIANRKGDGTSDEDEDVVFLTESNDANGKKYEFLDELYKRANVVDKEGNPDKTRLLDLNYVVVGGVGRESNYTSAVDNALSDGRTIAVVKRGDINFAEKVQIAMAHGAIGCIIYNNVSGTIRMSLGEVTDPIPTCSVSMDAGNILVNGATGIRGKLTFGYDYSAGPFMSDFSSWGPTPSLDLKPEITAHGGEITSSVPGGYETLSGTSMAAPNMSGAIAVLRQHVQKTTSLTGQALNNRVYQLLMSTATMARNEENNPYSPRKQGAGLAGIQDAINTKAYLTVSKNGKQLDKPKLELRDDKARTGVYNLEFDIHNTSGQAKSYTPDVYVMTESLSSDLKTVAEKAYMFENCDIKVSVDGAPVAEGGAVTVAGNSTAKIKVTITLDDGAKDYLNTTFANGMYVEGFVRLIDTDMEEGVDLGIPYLAFYGDWTDAPLFDWTVYEVAESEADRTVEEQDKKKASASSSRPLGLYDDGQYIVTLGSYLYEFGDTDKEIVASDERAAVSCYDQEGRRTVYELFLVYAGLLRGSKELYVTIEDSDSGEIVFEKTEINVRKSYAAGGSNIGSAIYFNLNPAEWNMANNKQYTVSMKGKLDYESETVNNDTFSFRFTVDTEAPIITDYRIRYEAYEENDETKYRIYVDTDVYDNQYSMSILPCYLATQPDGREALTLMTERPLPIYSSKGSTTTVSFEVTDIFETYVKTGNFYISVQDYAFNNAVYHVNYTEGTDYPEAIRLETDDKLVLYRESGLDGYPVYDLSLKQYELYKLNITSLPDTAAAAAVELTIDDAGVRCNGNEIFAVGSSGTSRVFVRGEDRKILAQINVRLGGGSVAKPIIEKIVFDPITADSLTVTTVDGFATLNPNKTTKFVPHVSPWYCEYIYDIQYDWKSQNPEVATVDAEGNVTTLRAGTAYIDVSVRGTQAAKSVRVSVTDELYVRNNILMRYYGGAECVIPDNLNIRSIYEEAFQYNTTLERLVLPISITEIPEDCFKGCINLKEIVIPAECTIIMANAFKDCVSLEKVTLLKDEDKFTHQPMTGVLNVAKGAFEGCVALKTIENSQRITGAFDRAFAGCTSLQTLDISGLRAVGKSVFEGCTSLQSVQLSRVANIGEAMFRDCSSLNNVTCYAGDIPAYAFYGCSSLNSFTFPQSVTSVGDYAFYNTGFTTLSLPDGTYGIGEKAFGNCANLISVSLGAGTNLSANGASPFVGCEKFTAFTAGNASHAVKDGMLCNSDGTRIVLVPYGKQFAQEYKIPDGVTEIDTGAFTGSKIQQIDLNQVQTLGAYAFSESSLVSIDVSGLTVIPEGAFYKCAALRSNSTTTGVKTVNDAGESAIEEVGAYAFAECELLRQKMNLPSVKKIGAHAFENTPLIDFRGDETEDVGAYAFYGTQLITAGTGFSPINLPRVQKLGDYAFANIGGRTGSVFREITLGAVTEMGEYVFSDNYALQSVTFGEGTTVIGNMAFVHMSSAGTYSENNRLKNVVVPSSVKTIGRYAFFSCTALSGRNIDLSNAETVGGYSFYQCAQVTDLDLSNISVIEPYTFAYAGLTSAQLNSATVIGTFAFANAPLTSLSIPRAEKLYPYAFYGTQLTAVEIPASLNTLTFEEKWERENDFGDLEERHGMYVPTYGSGAFANLIGLTAFTVEDGNPVYFAEDGVLYARTGRGQYVLLQYPTNKTTSEYRVKDGTVRIAQDAFHYVNRNIVHTQRLNKVIFPSTVKAIGSAAFYGCSATDYVFESVEAPVLEANVDNSAMEYSALGYSDLWDNAAAQGFYYSNFYHYAAAAHTGENQNLFDRLVLHRPANGRGYSGLAWDTFFKNVTLTENMPDDASRAFMESVKALKTPATLTQELAALSDNAAKLALLQNYSKDEVSPVRQAYNAITLADQVALIQEDYKTLLALEAFLREERGNLGDEVKETEMRVTYPDKYRYYVGEEFDPTGMVVRIVFEDGSIIDLDRSQYSLEGYNTPLTLSDSAISVSYGNWYQEIFIEVIERPVDPQPPQPPVDPDKKKGCGSEQAGITLGFAVLALGAAVTAVAVSKRRRDNR